MGFFGQSPQNDILDHVSSWAKPPCHPERSEGSHGFFGQSSQNDKFNKTGA